MNCNGVVLRSRTLRLRSLSLAILSAEGLQHLVLPSAGQGAPVMGKRYAFELRPPLIKSFTAIDNYRPANFTRLGLDSLICEFLCRLSRDADLSELYPSVWSYFGSSEGSLRHHFLAFYIDFVRFTGTGEYTRQCPCCQGNVKSYIVNSSGVACQECGNTRDSVCFTLEESSLLHFGTTASPRVWQRVIISDDLFQSLQERVVAHLGFYVGHLRSIVTANQFTPISRRTI
ncbi:hypothetical protein [Desulfurispira natronophila]|uniref:DNA repair protein RecO n=1 Tax=Desulfurispira natronophila TaxID=682562 RepID=A0A7W8DGP5_9BACT|nr:hypothetical protein [Desulfurispira natronophila]MBB5021706.1 hypothetical protein [Desulfurispira natronophila]